ncbi:TPA: aldo/keto reductase [Klebsiella pneumoniae]|nr:aldo/keto reductase [Klebsiella pneumoniae]
MVNLHFPYKFRESESLKSFLANEVKEGKNADKNVNQYPPKFFAKYKMCDKLIHKINITEY